MKNGLSSSELLPVIAGTNNRRNLLPRNTATLPNANAFLSVISAKKDSQNAEEKLGEQFRYFRREFMEGALNSGVTVPLDIVEDKTGHLFEFVKNGGPKYLLQVMQSNLENIHVLRCALSLLIIVITILRRKLPDQHNSNHHLHSVGHMASSTPDAIITWVLDALNKISEAGAVSTCIGVLIGSSNPSVQELALSLLTSVVAVSDLAVTQMLQVPSSMLSGSSAADREREKPMSVSPSKRSGSSGNNNPNATRSSTADATMGGSLDMGLLKGDAPQALLLPGGEAGSKAAPISSKANVDFSKFSFKYNTMDYSAKKPPPRRPPRSEHHSCLSYVLTVAMLQKNRHLLTAGCADIILLMIRSGSKDLCEAVAQSPTCPLPSSSDALKAGVNGGSGSSSGRRNSASTGGGNNKFSQQYGLGATGQAQGGKDSTASGSAQIVEWAGLKIMLKFLFRYQQMTTQPRSNSILRDSVSASLRLKDELLYAHTKVLTVVCSLVNGSSDIATFANTLPGAQQLIQLASAVHLNSLAITSSSPHTHEDEMMVQNCLDALQWDRDHQQRIKNLAAEEDEAPSPLMRGDSVGKMRPIRSSHSPNRRQSTSANGKNGALIMKAIGSEPRQQVLSASANLGGALTANLVGRFSEETEKGKLYLMNRYDGSYDSAASGAMQSQLRDITNKANLTTGLAYQPHGDRLLGSSLEAIDFATQRVVDNMQEADRAAEAANPLVRINPYLLPSLPPMTEGGDSPPAVNPLRAEMNRADDGGGNQRNTASQSLLFGKSVDGRAHTTGGSGSAAMMVDTNAMLLNHKFSVKTDLFDRLPFKPQIPHRIVPSDVITEGEDMNLIRDKFKLLADRAVFKISQEVGYTRNGKNSIPIEERARRIYSPSKKMSDMFSRAPSSRARTVDGTISGMSPSPTADSDLLQGAFSFNRENNSPGPAYSRGEGSGSGEYRDDFEDDQGVGTAWDQASPQRAESPPIYGLKMESSSDLNGDDLFDGFKAIFDYPAKDPPDLSAPSTKKDIAGANPRVAKLEMMQSLDMILA